MSNFRTARIHTFFWLIASRRACLVVCRVCVKLFIRRLLTPDHTCWTWDAFTRTRLDSNCFLFFFPPHGHHDRRAAVVLRFSSRTARVPRRIWYTIADSWSCDRILLLSKSRRRQSRACTLFLDVRDRRFSIKFSDHETRWCVSYVRVHRKTADGKARYEVFAAPCTKERKQNTCSSQTSAD